MLDRTELIVEEVDLVIDQAKRLATIGPTFMILLASDCLVGAYRDRIVGVFLVYGGREFAIQLSPSHLRLFHVLVVSHPWAKTADQIAWQISQSRSYARNGRPWRLARTSVKTFMMRIRKALERAFAEAHLAIDPKSVLVSEPTSGNATAFRLRAHITLTFQGNDEQ